MSEQLTQAPPPPTGSGGVPRWVVAALVAGSLVIIALLVTIVLLLVDSGGSDDGSSAQDKSAESDAKTFTASGDLVLITSNLITASGQCQGEGGYGDIAAGAQVVVRDSTGDTVAVDRLETGTKSASSTCTFAFEVADVPAGQGPYSVEVSHRGEISFDEQEADDIHLTLSEY